MKTRGGLFRFLIVLIAIFVHGANTESSECQIGPYNCTCKTGTSLFSGTEVDCRFRSIDTIPAEIPSQTTKLDLSNNPIKRLNLPSLSYLKELLLAHTQIETITKRDFSKFPKLAMLLLENSQIRNIHPAAFVSNPLLRVVILKQNPLKCDCDFATFMNWAETRKPIPLFLDSAECVQGSERFTYEAAKSFINCDNYMNPFEGWGPWSDWQPCHSQTSETSRERVCLDLSRCPGQNVQKESCRNFCYTNTQNIQRRVTLTYNWPQTQGGKTASVKCFPEIERLATRKCRSASRNVEGHVQIAEWETPSFYQCFEATPPPYPVIITTPVIPQANTTSEPMNTLTDNLEDLLTRSTSKNVTKVAEELASLTNATNDLTTADVDTSLKIIKKIQSAPNVSKGLVVKSLSNILNCPKQVLDEGEKKTKVAGRIVDEIHAFTKTLTTNSRVDYVLRNLAVVAVNKNQSGQEGLYFRVRKRNSVFQPADVEVASSEDENGANDSNWVQVQIPKSVLEKSPTSTVQFAIYGENDVFKVMQKEGTLNSKVVIVTLGETKVENLRNEKVVLKFRRESDAAENLCMFWRPETKEWSNNGCEVVSVQGSTVTCECDHMTNFALLMDVFGVSQTSNGTNSERHNIVLGILSSIGLSLSLLGVFITMAVYAYHRKDLLKDKSGRILMCICFCLAMTYIVFLTGGHYSTNDVLCKVIAAVLHFFILSNFTWTLVAAFYMYQSLIIVFPTYFRRFMWKASIFACGLPLLVVAVTIGVNTDNYGLQNRTFCWLGRIPFYAAFLAFIALIMIINLIVFILVVVQLRRMAERRQRTLGNAGQNNTWANFRALATLFTTLGLTWLLRFLYLGHEVGDLIVQYLFVIFVTTQGLVIFLLYCLGRRDARRKLLPCVYPKVETTLSKKASQGTSKFSQATTNSTSDGYWTSKYRKPPDSKKGEETFCEVALHERTDNDYT